VARGLSNQDKLAIALTSAGSMRNLAALVGVTHQKIGRWLREGQPAGVKSIPTDHATQSAIDLAFKIHTDIARGQSRVDNIPFNRSLPLYAERKPLSTGEIGDRVFVVKTEFISKPLRERYFADRAKTNRMYFGAVRSIIDVRSYFKGVAGREKALGKWKGYSQNEAARRMIDRWVGDERRTHGRIIDKLQPFPLYTQKVPMLLHPSEAPRVVANIEAQLRQKHEPATGDPGTVAADQYLFQLTPQGFVPYVKHPRKSAPKRPAAGSRARHIRGRGPK